MSRAVMFDSAGNAAMEFVIDDVPPDHRCVYARTFAEWFARDVLEPLRAKPDAVKVNQAKITLQDKWYSYRQTVPKQHRDTLGSRTHVCLLAIYLDCLARLHQIDLITAPPEYVYPEKRRSSAWSSDTIIGWDASLIDTLHKLEEDDE